MSDITIPDLQEMAADGPILVLFTAPAWCIPCKQFYPHWQASQDKLPQVKHFVEVDLGNSPEITFAQPIVTEMGIQSVPSVYLLLDDGGAIRIPHSGAARFVKEVESHLE